MSAVERLNELGNRIAPERVFLIAFLICSLFPVFLIPAGQAYDESNHIWRTWQLTEGGVLPQEVEKTPELFETWFNSLSPSPLYGGEVDSALVNLCTHNTENAYANKTYTLGDCTYGLGDPAYTLGQGERPACFSNSAVYSPVLYAPYVVGLAVARVLGLGAWGAVLLMRLCGIAFAAAGIYYAIKTMPVGSWVMTAIALLPNTIGPLAGVTADCVTFACCFVLIATSFSLALGDGSGKRHVWVMFAIAGIGLGFVKTTYAPLFALVGAPLLNPANRKPRRVALMVLVALCGFSLLFSWYFAVRHVNTGAMFNGAVDPTAQMQFVKEHPKAFAKALVLLAGDLNFLQLGLYGVMGGVPQPHHATVFAAAPLVMGAFSLVTYASAGVSDFITWKVDERTDGFQRVLLWLGCVAVVLIAFVLIALALYLQFTPVGAETIAGVQARYVIPLLVLVLVAVLAFVRWVATSRQAHADGDRSAGYRWLGVARIVFCGAVAASGLCFFVIQLATTA